MFQFVKKAFCEILNRSCLGRDITVEKMLFFHAHHYAITSVSIASISITSITVASIATSGLIAIITTILIIVTSIIAWYAAS